MKAVRTDLDDGIEMPTVCDCCNKPSFELIRESSKSIWWLCLECFKRLHV